MADRNESAEICVKHGLIGRTNDGDYWVLPEFEDTLTVALRFGRLSCADGDRGDLAAARVHALLHQVVRRVLPGAGEQPRFEDFSCLA